MKKTNKERFYERFKLKEYNEWELFLSPFQYPYIGRSYAWAKRDGPIEAIDMNNLEREELFEKLFPELSKALRSFSNPDRINLAIYANTTPHLHVHFIPRYDCPRIMYGEPFIDPNPRGNYSPYPKRQIPLEIIDKIKKDLSKKLN